MVNTTTPTLATQMSESTYNSILAASNLNVQDVFIIFTPIIAPNGLVISVLETETAGILFPQTECKYKLGSVKITAILSDTIHGVRRKNIKK